MCILFALPRKRAETLVEYQRQAQFLWSLQEQLKVEFHDITNDSDVFLWILMFITNLDYNYNNLLWSLSKKQGLNLYHIEWWLTSCNSHKMKLLIILNEFHKSMRGGNKIMQDQELFIPSANIPVDLVLQIGKIIDSESWKVDLHVNLIWAGSLVLISLLVWVLVYKKLKDFDENFRIFFALSHQPLCYPFTLSKNSYSNEI